MTILGGGRGIFAHTNAIFSRVFRNILFTAALYKLSHKYTHFIESKLDEYVCREMKISQCISLFELFLYPSVLISFFHGFLYFFHHSVLKLSVQRLGSSIGQRNIGR